MRFVLVSPEEAAAQTVAVLDQMRAEGKLTYSGTSDDPDIDFAEPSEENMLEFVRRLSVLAANFTVDIPDQVVHDVIDPLVQEMEVEGRKQGLLVDDETDCPECGQRHGRPVPGREAEFDAFAEEFAQRRLREVLASPQDDVNDRLRKTYGGGAA